MTHDPRNNLSHSRRGMTLLEVLLAVLLLSMTIGGVMAAVSSLSSMEANGRKRLAAFEIANRLMLMYLDDDKSLPSKGVPLAYGQHKFYWDLDETGAAMVINKKQEQAGVSLQALDRFKLIGVTVYEADGDEGAPVKGDPIAFLSRIIDPAAPRNPDSIETYNDPDKIGQLIGMIVGTRGPTGTGNTSRTGSQLK